jgi:hypothetical protein
MRAAFVLMETTVACYQRAEDFSYGIHLGSDMRIIS